MSADWLRYIVLFPLLGAIINGLVVRSKNSMVSGAIASTAILIPFLLSLRVFSFFWTQMGDLAASQVFLRDEMFTWISAGRVYVPFALELTPITAIMLLVVTGIGFLIHLYSISYISHDESPWRFFSYLNLFVTAMLVLVCSSNLVGVFLGWEGVGLCSYLLIGFWYKKKENTAAGMKAFICNRVGDLGFFVSLFIVFAFFGTAEISELLAISTDSNINSMGLPSYLWLLFAFGIFWASTGKSAQIPLYVWLPDAMAGPTPVSALIHAATMVTSGIVVISRLWPIFAGQPMVLDWIFWIGMATAWLAALVALTQNDIKKVLAYSTVSQLGFMFVALGAAAPAAAFFHVVTHACFKALLFLGAGSVIHGCHECQDLEKMGGLKDKMKFTHITFLVATLAIIGFPLSAGFFSKDMILAKAYGAWGMAGYLPLLGAALLTAFYMFRCYSLCFWGKARSDSAAKAHESSPLMYVPLIILAVFSVFIGWVEIPEVWGHQAAFSDWLGASWFGAYTDDPHHISHAAEWTLMIVSTICSLGVAYLAFRLYRNGKPSLPIPQQLIQISSNKFYVDEAYDFLIVKPLRFAGFWAVRIIDGFALNGGSHGLWSSVRIKGQALNFLHTGNIQTYAWHFLFWSAISIGAVILWIR